MRVTPANSLIWRQGSMPSMVCAPNRLASEETASFHPATKGSMTHPAKRGQAIVSRIHIIAPLFCAFAVAGCVRTDDGSVVPKYQVTMVRTGWFPHLAVRRTTADRRQPAREGEFLPPPPPPEEPATEPPATSRPEPRHHNRKRARHRPKHIAARKPETASKPSMPALKCRKIVLETGKSRVRCD